VKSTAGDCTVDKLDRTDFDDAVAFGKFEPGRLQVEKLQPCAG
jgi:hypothetical protein